MAQSAAIQAGAPTAARRALWRSLGFQVAVGMALGVLAGLIWPEIGAPLKVLGDLFLKLIKTIVAPLVFLTVAAGVGAAGDAKRLGKLGAVGLVYFEVVSTLALVFGWGMGVLLQVGKGLAPPAPAAHAAANPAFTAARGVTRTDLGAAVLNMVPDNFLGAFTHGDIMPVLVLALLFGIGLHHLPAERRVRIDGGLNLIASAFYAFTRVILALAPIAAFGSMAYAVSASGASVLLVLAWFVIAYYAAQVLFVVGVLGLICLGVRVDLYALLRFIRDEILVVLGTASSESVLPRLLEKLPAYGVSQQAAGLLLPTGYVFNLGGAAIYLTMATAFACNLYGVHPTLAQLGGMLLLLLVTSKGVATVTGGAFVTFAATAAATGIVPTEALPLMFGVYRLMSPANSTCNAIGNAVATVVVAKVCGEYDPSARSAPAQA